MLASIIGAFGTHVDCLKFINQISKIGQMNGGTVTKGTKTALGVHLKDNFSSEIKLQSHCDTMNEAGAYILNLSANPF